MRILIFTNRDLASNYHLNLILPHLHDMVKGIFISEKVGKKASIAPPYPLQELRFMEQGIPNEILFPSLEAQQRNIDDKLLTFNELSQKYNIPIVSCNDVKGAASLAHIATFEPDLIFSIRYGKVFGDSIIKLPTHGILNLHSGMLPNYRGVLAVFRALEHGDQKIYSTLHFVDDATLDTGRILGHASLDVDEQKSVLWHILHLYPQTIALSIATIRAIGERKTIKALSQPNENAAYFTFPTDEDFANYSRTRITDVNEMTAFYQQYL